MHCIKKFYQYLKHCAIQEYLDSKGIILNKDIANDDIFPPGATLTQKSIQEDKREESRAWEHAKRIILWTIPCTIIGLPLAICLILFLAPYIAFACLFLLVFIVIPIGLIWFVVYIIL